MKRFAITGVAGYIAPRHLKAIRDTGNTLVAAVDPHDSVGILDQYFEDVAFFTEFERFDRHLEKLRRSGEGRVEYVSICSPNHLHDAHIRLALRMGADAVCEKPLVINPWNLDPLEELAAETGRNIYTVMQLRRHPALLALRERLAAAPPGTRHRVTLRNVTVRGPWYRYSWKSSEEKSGGLAANIGIHFFDMLIWLFGGVASQCVQLREPTRAAGRIELANADADWFLSIEPDDLPFPMEPGRRSTFRSLEIDGEEVQFSDGFQDLHTAVYRDILDGRGLTPAEMRGSIELVHAIRTGILAPLDTPWWRSAGLSPG